MAPTPIRVGETVTRYGDLAKRIRLGEDSVLELKQVSVSGSRVKAPRRSDVADELAAFANGRGGDLVLGVDDKTRNVRGIPLDRLDAVEAWIREICSDLLSPALDATIRKIVSLLARCPAPTGLGRTHLMDRRGDGVPIILGETRELSGRAPEYELLDEGELRLTIPAATGDG